MNASSASITAGTSRKKRVNDVVGLREKSRRLDVSPGAFRAYKKFDGKKSQVWLAGMLAGWLVGLLRKIISHSLKDIVSLKERSWGKVPCITHWIGRP